MGEMSNEQADNQNQTTNQPQSKWLRPPLILIHLNSKKQRAMQATVQIKGLKHFKQKCFLVFLVFFFSLRGLDKFAYINLGNGSERLK